MTNQPTIRELLDACRADQHDPQRPELVAELAPLARELEGNVELQQLAERSERFDRNVRAALDDLAIPAGLMERMLAGCEAAVENPDAEKVAIPARQSWSRRQVIAIFSAAASLLILLVAGYQGVIWIFPGEPRPVGIDQLTAVANTWCDLSGPAAKWQNSAWPSKHYPLDRSIRVGPKRWAQIDKSTIVYELIDKDGKRARLFVRRTDRPHQIKNFPSSRLGTSGPHAMHAWQRNGYIYVIEFAEPDQRLQDFVQQSPIT